MALKENTQSGLVIVESPSKANTIKKILGGNFLVKASVGHIMDLPKKELGVDTDNGFEPKYVVIPGKEKVIKELQSAAKDASTIYLAPDPDREGEAIAWHISEVIASGGRKSNPPQIYRVTFNEITERAVKEAMKSPTIVDTNKVNAQQARRVLDRLVGYGLSPLLWKKVRRGLSAGRVQSVAVKLVVDREREIDAFQKEEYWTISGLFEGSLAPSFLARLFKYEGALVVERSAKGNNFLITSRDAADPIVRYAESGSYFLANVEKKSKKRMPSPPFITSTLQQEAAKKHRYPAKKTMVIAQKLYEGIEIGDSGSVGLITYMRTDSTRIAAEAQAWASDYIAGTFGKDYLPPKPHTYKVKANAQEAHEAIRPTYAEYPPAKIKQYLSRDQFAIYDLIWKRFIASQMAQADLEQTTFDILDAKEAALFRASGTIIKFKGFLALYSEIEDNHDDAAQTAGGSNNSLLGEESVLLPDLKPGEKLKLLEIKPEQHFTQPPPRYSEATLVKALEDKGIGRPSTYATILSTIVDRKYVEKDESRYKPTELGMVVNDLLVERFPELIDIQFTARMEDNLDKIEDGSLAWKQPIEEFYPGFRKELAEAENIPGKVKPEDKPTDITCEKCGSPMVARWGKHGRFLACSAYPECKNTRPLDNQDGTPRPAPLEEKTDEICDKCGGPMVIKTGKYGKFLGCSTYPACKNMKPLPTGIKCPLDGGDIIERKSRFGSIFYSCGNYPECKFTAPSKPVMEPCPNCGAVYLLEKTDKNGNLVRSCQNKECKYKAIVS